MSETLNGYFVPVYTSNEDYRDNGSAPKDERAAYEKIYRAALARKLSTGTVHAYAAGTWGPSAADELIAPRAWRSS